MVFSIREIPFWTLKPKRAVSAVLHGSIFYRKASHILFKTLILSVLKLIYLCILRYCLVGYITSVITSTPTAKPTAKPTTQPTFKPTANPTTAAPSSSPSTAVPTLQPTLPTWAPTGAPRY